jgi:hypothetical protein
MALRSKWLGILINQRVWDSDALPDLPGLSFHPKTCVAMARVSMIALVKCVVLCHVVNMWRPGTSTQEIKEIVANNEHKT